MTLDTVYPATTPMVTHPLRLTPEGAKLLLQRVRQAHGALSIWADAVGTGPRIGCADASPLQLTAAAIWGLLEAASAQQGDFFLSGLHTLYAAHLVGQLDLVLWNFMDADQPVAPKASALRATAEMAADLLEAFLVEHGAALDRRAAQGSPAVVIAH